MVPVGQPVLGVDAVARSVEFRVDRDGLAGRLDRFGAAIEPAESLGGPREGTSALDPRRVGGDKIAVRLERLLEVARGEEQIGLEPGPRRI